MTLRTTQELPARAEQPPPGIGHNNPPPETQTARSKVDTRLKERLAAANKWVADYRNNDGEIIPIEDEAVAGALEDFLKQLRDEWSFVDGERAKERKPLNDELKKIQDHYATKLQQIETAAALLKPLKASWLEFDDRRKKAAAAEAIRIANEKTAEAERLRVAAVTANKNVVEATAAADRAAQEASESRGVAVEAAQAKPQIKGESTGRASGYRVLWSAEIVDAKLALQHYATNGKILAALQSVADADAKALKERLAVPGIKPISRKVV